jgi:hypothetical protein
MNAIGEDMILELPVKKQNKVKSDRATNKHCLAACAGVFIAKHCLIVWDGGFIEL